MKISGGIFKGRIITTSKNKKIRSSSCKLKESVFEILKDKITGANFLDLFAGTASIAIEAYSRGAGFVTCVEKNPEALFVLMKNIKALNLLAKIKVLRFDVLRFLKNIKDEKYDIIFLDPPYGEVSLVNKVLYEISKNNLLKPNGLIIAEHYHKDRTDEKIEDLILFNERKYGQTCVSFYKKSNIKNQISKWQIKN